LIEIKEIQEIARKYKNPIGVVIGSHSALDALNGLRNYGIKGLVYVTHERAEIYFREPRVGRPNERIISLPSVCKRDLIVSNDITKIVRSKKKWKEAILLIDKYEDILNSEYQDGLIELEAIQIPNRAFSVYVGGYACERIEKDFCIPILGSRNLLKIENREEVEKNYYWYLEQIKAPYPKKFDYEVTEDGIRFTQKVEQPVVLKIPHASRRLERGFIFASNGLDLEEKVRKEVSNGNILLEDLKSGRAEEYIPGVTANFNFFYSPIYATEKWGDLEKYSEKWKLANELISIDERRETTHDGIIRMLAKDQLKAEWDKTPYPISFEVTAHCMLSLRESLLRKIYPIADSFVEITQKLNPPGMIGAYCIQTLITFEEQPIVSGISQGIYDLEGNRLFDFVFKVQDLATRHGGGTNVHMGIGSQYSNSKYMRTMSMGDRIALELFIAKRKKKLDLIVT
jgi:5-formaminoimidazole-4-carboxamide-1-(beta)-D-ribofuranosyl 5'-monophosphate synthetase